MDRREGCPGSPKAPRTTAYPRDAAEETPALATPYALPLDAQVTSCRVVAGRRPDQADSLVRLARHRLDAARDGRGYPSSLFRVRRAALCIAGRALSGRLARRTLVAAGMIVA